MAGLSSLLISERWWRSVPARTRRAWLEDSGCARYELVGHSAESAYRSMRSRSGAAPKAAAAAFRRYVEDDLAARSQSPRARSRTGAGKPAGKKARAKPQPSSGRGGKPAAKSQGKSAQR